MKAHFKVWFTVLALALAALVMITLASQPARAAGPWYVAPGGNDGNACTSPGTACATINGALAKPGFVISDTILVASGTYTGTGSEVVSLNISGTLSGGWDGTFTAQSGTSTIDGEGTRRGITVNSGVTAMVERFTVQNGSSDHGGGVNLTGNSALTLNNSTISNNTAGFNGGGISSYGALTLNNSTISNNTAGGNGGGINSYGALTLNNSTISGNTGLGIYNGWGGSLTLNNSTSSNNTAGIYNQDTVTLQSTILAGNTGGPDCSGAGWSTINSSGYNLVGNTSGGCNFTPGPGDLTNIDAKLGPLQDNGGPTETHALLSGSPAIDAGDDSACPATDQRGVPRPQGGQCDIGAVEAQGLETSNKAVNISTTLPGTPLTYTIALRNVSDADVSNVIVTDTIPVFLTYHIGSLTATSGTYGEANGVITWTGSVNAGGAVTITFGATVSQTLGSIVNSAVISGGGEIITRTATVNVVSQVKGVAISGPTAGIVQTSYTFIATVNPITATLPITYVWQTTGQSPVMHTDGGLSDIITFTWSTTGTQAITVTATNAGGTVTGTATINVIDGQICNLTKHAGNPVLSVGAGGSWDNDRVWGPAVFKEGDSYKMWYTGDDGSNPSQIGLAISTNGITWTKEAANPVLSPSQTWEANGVMAGGVISDSGLYKMWYTGFDSSGVARIGYATSPDGVNWTKYGSNPVLDVGASGSWEDEDVMEPTVIKEGGTYHIWYRGYDGMTNRIGHATSSNGTSWTKDTANPVLDVGPPGDWDWLDVYGPSVVKVGGEYKLWYSGETLPQAWQTGYALSSNGSDWTRQEMLIPEGPSGTFDADSADYPSVIVDGAEFKVWYSGLNDGGIYNIGYATAEICDVSTAPLANLIYLPIIFKSCPAYYTDDFSDPDSGWPVDDNSSRRYAYTGGQYQIWVKNPSQGWSVTPGAKATDFTAAVSARRASGSSGGYGIVFGLNEDWSEYYEFDIGPNNYSIWRYDGSWTALRNWTASSAIGTGTSWNRLKVIRNGANITVYVNNQYLTTVTDSSFTGLRRIGLLAVSPGSGSLDARFDDFSLYPASCGASAAGVGFEMGEPGIHEAPMPPGLDQSP